MYYGFHTKKLSIRTVHNFNKKKCFLSTKSNISEWSCDTEDQSNDCWKFSFAITEINYILKYIKTEKKYFKLNNISQSYCFYCIFD